MFYAIARVKVTNPDSLAAYREKAADALAKHGGKVESASAECSALDGAPDTDGIVAVLSFPDKAAAEAWAHDPELEDIHTLRRGAGQSDIFAVG